jgi:hypothetical protein
MNTNTFTMEDGYRLQQQEYRDLVFIYCTVIAAVVLFGWIWRIYRKRTKNKSRLGRH